MNWKYKSPDCKGGILEDGTFIFDMFCKTCLATKHTQHITNFKWAEQ